MTHTIVLKHKYFNGTVWWAGTVPKSFFFPIDGVRKITAETTMFAASNEEGERT